MVAITLIFLFYIVEAVVLFLSFLSLYHVLPTQNKALPKEILSLEKFCSN